MIETGRLCVKLAGRDAGKKCVIVEILDKNFVMIDGNVRRRKCNKTHVMPLNEKIDIKNKASHSDVAAAFKKLKLEVWETKPKKAKERPKKVRKGKTKEEKEAQKKSKKSKYAKKEVKVEKESGLEKAVAKETKASDSAAKVEAKKEITETKADAKQATEKAATTKNNKN